MPATGSLPHFLCADAGRDRQGSPSRSLGCKARVRCSPDLMGGRVPIAADTSRHPDRSQHEARRLRVLHHSAKAPQHHGTQHSHARRAGRTWSARAGTPCSRCRACMAPATVQRLSQLVQEVMKVADTQQQVRRLPTWCAPVVSSAQVSRENAQGSTARNGAGGSARVGFKP